MGLFEKSKQGLKKTGQLLSTDIRDLFKGEGRLVDEAFLDEWFDILVKCGIDGQIAREIVDELRNLLKGRVVQWAEVEERLSSKLKSRA